MRKQFITIIICIGCYLMTFPAFAEGWNLGFKLAYIEPDEFDVSSSDNAGLVLGYDWVQSYGVVGVESDFTTSFIDGSINGQDFSIDTLGVHATYKTIGPSKGLGVYLKLKAGAMYYDIDATNGPQSKNDIQASVGLGVGINMGYVAFELDYTTIKDVEMVSLAILF
jgi:hypothetical protein